MGEEEKKEATPILLAQFAKKNAAIIVAMTAVVAIALLLLGQNPSCGSDANCFKSALRECKTGASMAFSDSVPTEGKFSYAYTINGEKRITASGKACEIAFAANQTMAINETRSWSGSCLLRGYSQIDLQYDWARFDAPPDGACLRLERKLSGSMG